MLKILIYFLIYSYTNFTLFTPTCKILKYFTCLLLFSDNMSKTQTVIERLNEGKTPAEIKAELGVSDALISRCKKNLDKAKTPETKPEKEPEEEPTDEEIDAIIKRIAIKPEEKYFTSDKDGQKEEDYTCGACKHEWKAKEMPKSCPKCGCEFE